jgi:hypothetical protein
MPRTFTHVEDDLVSQGEFQPQTQRAWQRQERYPLLCRGCGGEGTIDAHWSEISYGTATVRGHDGDLDDYNTDDSDNFEINSYVCTNCDLVGDSLYDVALREDEDFVEEQE